MKHKKMAILAGLAVTALAGAEPIGVYVDGQRVQFQGAGPQSVNGRVLVPLRGVLEQLGAYVGWDSNTRLVTANRGDIDLELHIGDRYARVNGKTVMLDVPAQIYRGSTLVPLRFMSESLGANVLWDPNTYSVRITTSESASQRSPGDYGGSIPNDSTQPKITTFRVTNTDDYIHSNDTVEFELLGTPGGIATFQIPGVLGTTRMREVSSGRYVGTWQVSDTDRMSLRNANAIAKLQIGTNEQLIQLANPIQIDTDLPTIEAMMPNESARVVQLRPNISAVFNDGRGSGIDESSVRIMLDGRNVTRDATITSNFISYRPENNLSAGSHEVTITGRDLAGNSVNRSWRFVIAEQADLARSFTFTDKDRFRNGDTVTFTLLGEPNSTITVDIGDRNTNIPLREVSSGRYVGEYVIRRSDRFSNEPVVARIVSSNGSVYTVQAENRLNMTNTNRLGIPTITSPVDNATVGNSFVIRGTAEPYSDVHIKVNYTNTVLGALNLNGTLADVIVKADANGRFQTRTIQLNNTMTSRNTRYTIIATTVGSNNQESEAAEITLTR